MNIRFIILIIFLILSYVAINPQFDTEGAAIRQVERGSPAAIAGIESPTGAVAPTQREVIRSVNGNPIIDVENYFEQLQQLSPNQTFTLQTNRGTYRLRMPEMPDNVTEDFVLDIGLTVYEVPSNNIRKGLDLSGGTRVILQPQERIDPEDLDLVIDNIEQRLNVFGLSDIVIRSSRDLAGDDFIVVEIAGAQQSEVAELLANQGVFEAKIANQTVFSGGDDITFVCRSPDCSGIDSRQGGCRPAEGGGFTCRYSFSITLSQAAANRQAQVTNTLSIVTSPSGASLSEPLDLFLDGELIDSLSISADLRGRAVTDIQISGSGSGATQQLAIDDAMASMRQQQTILVTGSLPVSLDIVKMDAISPVLGAEFVRNAIIMAIVAILAVATVIFIRYRRLLVSIPVIVTMLSEGFIILGFAALIGWNLDLVAIAGILIVVGTGVDHQIVIIDEALRKEEKVRSWRERFKRAFFIIFAAYITTVVAMIPLMSAGAGLLRGFAITTIVGATIGVLITRPAFAAFIERFVHDEDEE